MADTVGIRSTLSMKSGGMFLLVKIFGITVLILLALWGRGVSPALVVIIFVIPLWLIAERVMFGTSPSSLWKSIEEREDFSRLPLQSDVDKVKGAKKGQKVKQAILEGRVKDQVFYTLKNEYNLSDEEINDLDKDPESMADRIDNENLLEYLKHAKDLNDIKKPKDLDKKEEGEDLDFENKMESAVSELESIHYVNIKEDGD